MTENSVIEDFSKIQRDIYCQKLKLIKRNLKKTIAEKAIKHAPQKELKLLDVETPAP